MTTLYYYSAPWCGPCKFFKPIFDDVAAEMPNVEIRRINVDEVTDPSVMNKALQHRVRSVPTLVKEIDNIPVATFVGSMTEPQLRAFVGG